MHQQPGRGAVCIPNNERILEQQNRAFRKARQAAASAPRLAPARVPVRKAIEIPKAPSCLQIGAKRPRDGGGGAALAGGSSTAPTSVAKATAETQKPEPVLPQAKKPEPILSLVTYDDSESEEEVT